MDFNECSCSGKSLARLLQPAVMAVLAKEPAHGYSIVRDLRAMEMFGAQPPDPAGVYRLLRTMEDAGLVESDWDLPGSGPAKRCFRLTARGRKCLARWVATLETYQRAIGELLRTAQAAARRKSSSTRRCGCAPARSRV